MNTRAYCICMSKLTHLTVTLIISDIKAYLDIKLNAKDVSSKWILSE